MAENAFEVVNFEPVGLGPVNSRRRSRKARGQTSLDTASSGATIGWDSELRRLADGLRGSMDAAKRKQVDLGRIFPRYISDAFEEQHAKLEPEHARGVDPDDPDDYGAANVFWASHEARWPHPQLQRGREFRPDRGIPRGKRSHHPLCGAAIQGASDRDMTTGANNAHP